MVIKLCSEGKSGAIGREQEISSRVARPQGKKRVFVRYYYKTSSAKIHLIYVFIWNLACRIVFGRVGCSRLCFAGGGSNRRLYLLYCGMLAGWLVKKILK